MDVGVRPFMFGKSRSQERGARRSAFFSRSARTSARASERRCANLRESLAQVQRGSVFTNTPVTKLRRSLFEVSVMARINFYTGRFVASYNGEYDTESETRSILQPYPCV